MKHTISLAVILFICVLVSCKQKDKEPPKNYISVVSLIRKQVAHVDTSLYPIIKIVSQDSLRHDTTFIPREQFAAEAKDFLEIPDLSDKKVAKRYKEEPPRYDELLGPGHLQIPAC